ncbi:MAG: hypothetical protein R6V10_16950 [bacterium]
MNEIVCEECGKQLLPESMHCPHCGAFANHEVPTEVRCECGFLLCKLSEEYLEIKCRRCKKVVFIPIADFPGRFINNRSRQKKRYFHARGFSPDRNSRMQACSVCGKPKPDIIYGKCLDCRTEFIKVQYRSRSR